ncbi:MAG: hypothetical protein V3V61_06515 [Gammaproteobacteria bacterium]
MQERQIRHCLDELATYLQCATFFTAQEVHDIFNISELVAFFQEQKEQFSTLLLGVSALTTIPPNLLLARKVKSNIDFSRRTHDHRHNHQHSYPGIAVVVLPFLLIGSAAGKEFIETMGLTGWPQWAVVLLSVGAGGFPVA